jgi:TonB-dependent starch-binding outer membrane protein SusC
MRKCGLLQVTLLILCALYSSFSFAQERKISGTVRDDKQAPLAGATVTVKGTEVVTTTDASGKFSITVPQNRRTLVISYVGMQPSEVSIGSSDVVNVALAPTASALTDVVVVGYGRARRANLTTAQTSVSAKDIEKTVNTTLEQAIQGRAAGVYITQNSGQPGGGISVNVRGISSINGNTQPLYVIDGVQLQGSEVNFGAQSSSNSLAGLNPADIEDIQILQGPSATAIYGSRATNGVILITTKRGRSGDAKLNYVFQYNIQTPPKKLEVMNLREYAQMVKEFHVIAGGTTPGEFLDPSLLGNGTSWQDELFNNAPMSKHQLSLSGGNNNTTYYMSGEYMDQKGVAIGSGFKRYGFRLNLDNKPREWVTLGANLSYNQTNEVLTTSQENIISNALQLTPQIPVKNLNGTWGGGDETNGANQFAPVNPIAIASMTTNNNVRRQFLGGLNLGLNLYKGLTFRTSFNANVGNGVSTYYVPTYAIGWAINATASLENGTSSNTYWNWNQLLEYNNTFGKHTVGLMVSHEAQESKWKNVYARRTGFLTNDILDLNAGDPTTASNSGGSGTWAMESYLGRVNYNYDNRYIVVGTVRRDGSVNFGSENRWGTFPSVSAAWRVNNEEFFNIPFVSDLKIRLETGLTGNQGGGAGIYSPLSTGATSWGTGFLPAVYPNPKLKWEETRTDNIGLNLGFLNNRITLEADYYQKSTKNLIMPQSLPWYMGTNGVGSVAPPTVNAGSLETKGWNFSVSTVNFNTRDFKWESNLNLSHFKTTIVSLNSENAFFERTSWWLNNWTQRAAIGYAPWLFRGYVEEGLFQSLEEIQQSAVPVDNQGNRLPIDQQNGLWVGDVKLKDINGDGKIDVNDMTYIGNPWPKLFGGFTNTFTYKGVELSVLITGTFGNDVYNYLAAVNSNPNNINLSRNLLIGAMDYARPTTDANGKPALENPGSRTPRISYGPNGNYARITDKWVENGSFIRLKNVSLSYSLPNDVLSKTKIIKGARATIGAQNLFTITDYSGFDPEVGSYVGRDAGTHNQAIGLDFGRYPLTPIYTFSLSVNF